MAVAVAVLCIYCSGLSVTDQASMSVIQKVANRIQARRRGTDSSITSTSSVPSEQTSVTYSATTGHIDNQTTGFCVVDETDGSDQHSSDLQQVTEDLFGDFDYESEEQPKPKPVKKKPWQEASKDVYEQQLELLQEQLTSTIMAKQAVECTLTLPLALTYTNNNTLLTHHIVIYSAT